MNENTGALPPLSAADLALLKEHIASQGLPAQVAAITSDAPRNSRCEPSCSMSVII